MLLVGGESQPQEQGQEKGCQGGDEQGASKEPHSGDLQPHEQGHNHLADYAQRREQGQFSNEGIIVNRK